MNNFLEIKNHDIIKLSPKYLDGNLTEHIQKTLKNKYEGLCSKFGYIKSNSIRVLNIKEGVVERSTFHGYVRFDVEFSSMICNPAINSIIECNIKNINSFGVLCVSGLKENGIFNSILNIIVPKNHHNFEISNNIEFDKLKIGDNVYVEILGKKYILNNKNINVFGRIVDKDSTSTSENQFIEEKNEVEEDDTSDEEEIELEDTENEIENDIDNDIDNDIENEIENEIEINQSDIIQEVDKESELSEDDKSDDDIDEEVLSDNEETFD